MHLVMLILLLTFIALHQLAKTSSPIVDKALKEQAIQIKK